MVIHMEMLKCDRCGKVQPVLTPAVRESFSRLVAQPVHLIFEWRGHTEGIDSLDLCSECVMELAELLKKKGSAP